MTIQNPSSSNHVGRFVLGCFILFIVYFHKTSLDFPGNSSKPEVIIYGKSTSPSVLKNDTQFPSGLDEESQDLPTSTLGEDQLMNNISTFSPTDSPIQPYQTDSILESCNLLKHSGPNGSDHDPGRPFGRPVQFIHVPKAGGTSIQVALYTFAKAHHVEVFTFDNGGPWYEPKHANQGLFLGHRGFGFSENIFSKSPVTIVVIREPVSRMVSIYDYLRTTTAKFQMKADIIRSWSGKTFDEIIANYNRTRTLHPKSLRPGGGADISDYTIHRFLQHQPQFLCGYNCVWPINPNRALKFPNRAEQLKRALENLERIDCVTVLEELNSLIVQMKIFLDFIPGLEHFPHENVAKAEEKTKPKQETIEMLKLFTKDDEVIYHRAREITRIKTENALNCIQQRGF